MSSIRTDDLLRTLPRVLKNDKRFHAFATVIAKQLRILLDEVDLVTIYARIDELPETLLDILAYDFKVDWWDYDYTIEQKRQTLKDSWMVHKHLGTKYAVETALSAIYPTKASEWFEYGGNPYCFRLHLNTTNHAIEYARHARVLALTDFYKNLRSHLDSIEYTINANEDAILRIGGRFATIANIGIPQIPDELSFAGTIRIGGKIASVATLSIPLISDTFDFSHTTRIGGSMGAVTTLTIPEASDAVTFEWSENITTMPDAQTT